jgi:proteasome accessory factor C
MPFLTSHPGISTAEVADEFGVDKEQIIKDLALLHMCGLPGYTPLELIDISYDDGIVHVRDAQNLDRPRNLTLAEVLIVRIALQALLDYLPPDNATREEILSLDRKLRASFANTVPENSLVSKEGFKKSIFSTLDAAIEERRKVRIRYSNIVRDEKTERVISPYSIMVDGTRTLIHAWCDLAGAQRSFVLDRIESAELLDEVSNIQSSNSDDVHSVALQISEQSEFLREHSSKLKRIGSHFQLDVFQYEWLIREVLSNLGEVQVLTPTETRRLVCQRAKEVRSLY